MKWQQWSRRQRSAAVNARSRINFFHGPVRSGKTTAQRVAWLNHVKNAPHPNLLVSGKTKDTIKRNVLDDFFAMLDAFGVRYAHNSSSGTIRTMGKTMHIVGANDEGSVDRIHGMTIGGWLGDELTLHPESFVKMALSRMSMAGARAFWTTNPDSPFHYLKKEYLDNTELVARGIVNQVAFRLTDNLSLDAEYLESLQLLYTGLWKKRFIDGLWVQAEGAIYDLFDPDVHVIPYWPDAPDKVVVGVDYGTSNATAFLMLGRVKGTWYVLREYYWDARERGRQKTDGEYAEDLKAFLRGYDYPDPYGHLYPSSIEVDPSAASFRLEAKRRGVNRVRLAENEVLDGIHTVANSLEHKQLLVHQSCERTIEEAVSYVWDPKAQEKGEDRPLKEGARDHALDALRYAAMSAIGKKGLQLIATA